ncbi:3796_t:CDS:2, partial [Entrophospora sp. SA101]
EKKLAKVICPDKWKEGSRNVNVGTDRKLNENKLLSKPGKNRFKPYENKCKVCKSRVHQEHAHYCQGCAYKQGICAMCAVYGEDNELRLTGAHETGHISQFSSGVANRGASIRIPRHVAAQGYGYMEDRRPASNIDPYRVTHIIVETTLS